MRQKHRAEGGEKGEGETPTRSPTGALFPFPREFTNLNANVAKAEVGEYNGIPEPSRLMTDACVAAANLQSK